VARLLVGYLAYLERQIADRQASPAVAGVLAARVGEAKP
jgi:hypothetical protein